MTNVPDQKVHSFNYISVTIGKFIYLINKYINILHRAKFYNKTNKGFKAFNDLK